MIQGVTQKSQVWIKVKRQEMKRDIRHETGFLPALYQKVCYICYETRCWTNRPVEAKVYNSNP